jgi:hypothetical protein
MGCSVLEALSYHQHCSQLLLTPRIIIILSHRLRGYLYYDRYTLRDSSVLVTEEVLISMYVSLFSQGLMMVFSQVWQL